VTVRTAGDTAGNGDEDGSNTRFADEEVGTGVARTALLVAAARAIETHRPDALARDEFAEHFVRAARASAGWPVRPEEVPEGDADPLWGRLGRYFGLRTRVLDDFLLDACGASGGARQVVVLGAGLDARAFRLAWPPGRVVYEIDAPGVLAFKGAVLDRLGAVPGVSWVPVGADLREDWAAALARAGFDPALPTAWLVEGVLLYLPAAAETRLLETVDELSPAGSALACEVKFGAHDPEVRDSPIYAASVEHIGVDLLALFDTDPRPDSAALLAARGWTATVAEPFAYARRFGRGPSPEPRRDALAGNRWVLAHKAPAAQG
jgi:methyltransferase (TIGR00027 family)